MRQIARRPGLGCLGVLVLVTSGLVACAGAEPREPTATRSATAEPTSTTTPAPPLEESPVPHAAPSGEYDPTETMFGIFSGPSHAFETTLSALERARDHGDRHGKNKTRRIHGPEINPCRAVSPDANTPLAGGRTRP